MPLVVARMRSRGATATAARRLRRPQFLHHRRPPLYLFVGLPSHTHSPPRGLLPRPNRLASRSATDTLPSSIQLPSSFRPPSQFHPFVPTQASSSSSASKLAFLPSPSSSSSSSSSSEASLKRRFGDFAR
eukprot:5973653-Pyramimonas_sp.AAC.1